MHYALNANMYICTKTWTLAIMKAYLHVWSINDEKAIGEPPSRASKTPVRYMYMYEIGERKNLQLLLFISFLYPSYSSSSSSCQTGLLHDSSIYAVDSVV